MLPVREGFPPTIFPKRLLPNEGFAPHLAFALWEQDTRLQTSVAGR